MNELVIPNYTVHDDKNIIGFFGPYRWLSNFWQADVYYESIRYPSTEHAYQAAKVKEYGQRQRFSTRPKMLDLETQQRWVDAPILTAGEAKKRAHNLPIRDDWEHVKYDVMMAVVFDKFFRNRDLRDQLLATGNKHLEEANSWNDVCWGVCRGKGKNALGQILMNIRQLFKNHKELSSR